MNKSVIMHFAYLLFFPIMFLNCSGAETGSSKDTSEEKEEEVVASIKVMSYNIHHANPPSKPDVIDLDAIVGVIKAQDPDLVALQEVDNNTERSGEGNQAEMIAEKLGMYVYFAKALNYEGGGYGNAILSKYPLENSQTYNLPNEPGSNTENRVMAAAKIKLPDGTEIIFASTHLDYKANSPSRILQLKKIIEISKEEAVPMIIAGDFNDSPGSETINLLDNSFTLSCRSCPPTIPVNQPTRAIDFIAFRHPENKFKAKSHQVIDETYASDHLPIVAQIELLSNF